MYCVEEDHAVLPRNRKEIDATIDLVNGDRSDLPTDIPERRFGWLSREFMISEEAEAEQLRRRIESGDVRQKDIESLYYAY